MPSIDYLGPRISQVLLKAVAEAIDCEHLKLTDANLHLSMNGAGELKLNVLLTSEQLRRIAAAFGDVKTEG